MSKQSVERQRRRRNQSEPQPPLISKPTSQRAGTAEEQAAARPRRYLQPYELDASPGEDLRRLTSSPLLPDRLNFMNPAQLFRWVGLIALLLSFVGTLGLRQSWSNVLQPAVLVFGLTTLVTAISFAYTTRRNQQLATSVLVGAVLVEIVCSAVGVNAVGFSSPLYFSVIPFYVVIGHIQVTFTTRPAIWLTGLVWLAFCATLVETDESFVRSRFWVLLLLLSVPVFVVTMVARFIERESRQRARLIEALAELQQSQERYRQVTDRANDAILIMDNDGRLSFVNPRTVELSGYTEDELLGRRLGEILTNDSRAALGQVLRDRRTVKGDRKEAREPGVLALEMICKNGSRRLTEVTTASLSDRQNQMQGWVAIARDVTERTRLREQAERRNRDLSALNAIVSAAGQSLDLDRLLNDVVTTLVEVLKADVAGITLIEEGTRLLKVGAYKGLSDTVVRAVTNFSINETRSLTHEVATTGQTLLIEDLAQENRLPGSTEIVDAMGLRAFVAVPIKSRDEILGVVSLISHRPAAFRQDDLDLLTAIGKSLAVSIENARLYGRSLNQVREMTCLAEIARAINLSQSLGQTLTNIAQTISTALHYKACAISLLEPDQLLIQTYGVYGMPAGFMDRLSKLSQHNEATREELLQLPLFATLHSQELKVYPVKPLEGVLSQISAQAQAQGWKMVLTVPFSIQGRPAGVISCYTADNVPPPESELRLLGTIANQTSLAVQNAYLYREQQRRADQLRAVSEIGRQIGSILSLDELLPFITRLLQQTFDYYMVGIFLADPDLPNRMVLRAAHGWNPALVTLGTSFDIEEQTSGLVGWVAQNGEALVVPDISKELRFQDYDDAGLVKSEMVVPIKRGPEVIGVIDLASTLLNGFDEIDLATMQALAEQVGITLENARLYTEVNRVVVQLTSTNVELEEATRHKSEFLANMSHELRTPLNAIIGFSEVLQDKLFGDLNDKQTRYVYNIVTSGRHLLTLVNDVLDLAKVEAGRMELHLEDFQPQEATQDVENILSVSASRKNLRIENRFEANLPTLRADKSKYKQILYNLLSNAVKFTPDNGHIMTGVYRHQENGQEFLAVWVKDTGIGIRREDQRRIFEEFRQVDSSYSRQHQGTGLGLALSKRLVELHEGRIWVESEPGTGSLFTFLLPLNLVAVQAFKAAPAPLDPIDRLLEVHVQNRLEKQISREKQTQKLADRRPIKPTSAATSSTASLNPPVASFQPAPDERPLILVVDDDDRAAEILTLYLDTDYRVERARDGVEALEKAARLAPALITLDVLLPGKDGWQVLVDLQANPTTQSIPVVMISIASQPDQTLATPRGFLSKPVLKDQLLTTVSDALKNEPLVSYP